MKNIPWVEKYRPSDFNDIVINKENKQILENIVKKRYFPNLLFYGPPGTGKTTTIINLIKKYQEQYDEQHKELVIHLNASDERGIDVIRNQIKTFVNSKNLFGKGVKFVILDEIDYMTKNAQEALKSLMNEYRDNICFCLICNYISKIDIALQNILVKLRFNELPYENIINFLSKIVVKENITNIKKEHLHIIKNRYNSDLRSMINYLQMNHNNIHNNLVCYDNIVKNIYKLIKKKCGCKILSNEINKILTTQNIEIKELLIHIFDYIIKNNVSKIKNLNGLLNNMNFIVHNLDLNEQYLLKYTINIFTSIELND
jgi:DNA polymerase III delta prime subunit